MGKYTITESGYKYESDHTLTDTDINSILELELKLAELPSRHNNAGKAPKAIIDRRGVDDQTVLAFVASQESPRARRYIEEHCDLPERQIRAALKRLFLSQELELRPSTYTSGAGKERPMQGVFFTEVPEESKTSFLSD